MSLLNNIKSIFNPHNASSRTVNSPSRPEYVMSTSADGSRTSLVTVESIRHAVHDIGHGLIVLTRCIPVETKSGQCHSIVWGYEDGSEEAGISVYIDSTDNGSIRYVKKGSCSPEKAIAVLTDFFKNDIVPDIDDWHMQYRLADSDYLEPQVLYVDREEYERFDLDDVIAAIEMLENGMAGSVMLQAPSGQYGYLEVSGGVNDYKVELTADNSDGDRVGFRTHTRYGGHVRHWFSDYYNYKLPTLTPDWEEFDVEAYFKELKGVQ